MPRIQHLAILACTLAFLLPACDPPDDPDTSMGGPSDLVDAPDEPEDEPDPRPDPRPNPRRPNRLCDAPRSHDVLPADADHPEDLLDAPHGHDICPEPPEHLDDLADA